MSVEAVHWALKQTTDEAVDKLILIAMANYADETHSSWPSRKKLAAAGMCSVDTVDRANRRLEARNLIRKSARMHKGGAHSSNFYELNVEGGWPHHAATLAAPACGHPSRIGCGHKEPSLEPSLEPAPLPPSPDEASLSGQANLKGFKGNRYRPSIRISAGDLTWATWLEYVAGKFGSEAADAISAAGGILAHSRWPSEDAPLPEIAR